MKIDVAVASSVTSKSWRNNEMEWEDFAKALHEPTVTRLTMAEYRKASKTEQKEIKDVGGYVGGYLLKGKRSAESVVHRQLVTLDVDYAHLHFWDDFTMQFGCEAILHGTHSHTKQNPRYRLILPLDREVSQDEYVAIGRKIAGLLGIDRFDNTTFEVNRLMFWPAHPADVDFYIEHQSGDFLSADDILGMYRDWTNTSEWPTATRLEESIGRSIRSQADPLEKQGWVGVFCRTYDIHEAIEAFLSEEYERVDTTRYTYVKGSTAAGLVTYDDKFAYSHHGTDPASGQTCNAFDLVRLHKFGYLDEESNSSGVKAPSFQKMVELCQDDAAASKTNNREKTDLAKYEFAAEPIEGEPGEEEQSWVDELETDRQGNIKPIARNFDKILRSDAHLKGRFKTNEFEGRRYIVSNVPWRTLNGQEVFADVDYSGVRNYIESVYDITSTSKIEDSIAIISEQNKFHPVRAYLDKLKWDGQERVDRLLIDTFGAADNIYTREAMRKTLVGACARVYQPGVKFDLVLVLVGKQGTGKSTFFAKLGGEFFSDSFTSVSGKEAFEQIQGVWMVEIAELAALRKAEVEAIKHFITKTSDEYRPAYGRVKQKFPRQCVFVGTTNNVEFLRDVTGNRRFMPVSIHEGVPDMGSLSPSFNQKFIDQVWAEAVHMYRNGESLTLSPQANAVAELMRADHSQTDDRGGIVGDWLDKPVTKDWDGKTIEERMAVLADPKREGEGVERKYTCLVEIWVECFGKDRSDFNSFNSRQLSDIMTQLPQWELSGKIRSFKHYGRQKYYERVGKDA